MIDPHQSHETDEEDSHRGGAWKVAYADFVTALMALFIVLWLLNSTREVRDSVSGYFRDPHANQGTARAPGSGPAGSGESLSLDHDSVSHLRQKLEQAMHDLKGSEKFAKYVQFTVTGEGLRIELMERDAGMFFETGSAAPTNTGEELFRLLAQQLGELPNSVAIEGHTDARAFHSQDSAAYGNWELSFDRANMARRIMLMHGLKEGQIAEIRGYADRQPVQSDDLYSSRNRRVSVIVKYSDR
jgi:chemotaxis protein MotB